jgi:hypothetical protein
LNERGDKLVIIHEHETVLLNLVSPSDVQHIQSSLPGLISSNLLLIARKNQLIRMQLNDLIFTDTLVFDDDIKAFYLPNDQLICVAFRKAKTLQIADADKSLVFRKLPFEEPLKFISVSKDQRHISTITDTDDFKLYNVKDSTLWQPMLNEKSPIWMSFFKDNTFLIYTTDKIRTDQILIFDAQKSLLKSLDIHVIGVPLSFLLDETSNVLIVTYTDYSTRIIDLNTLKIKELKGKLLLNSHYFESKKLKTCVELTSTFTHRSCLSRCSGGVGGCLRGGAGKITKRKSLSESTTSPDRH